MGEADEASMEPASDMIVQPEPASPSSRVVIRLDLLWKILAVLGVVFLVYVLLYLGTWLAMLN